ncbi:MAG TPA: hypothetical protein VMR28_01700 [Candidatus Saccharimonadales bacterium]|nr:hypothetical protein [Candidatus Saccharimonadales bacterium]
MKLVLAYNQSDKFVSFYSSLQQHGRELFDYSGYDSLLFIYDHMTERGMEVVNLSTDQKLDQYDGVYINGYLKTYELAAATAICCEALKVPYVNKEMHDPPSLSKLTAHAKLAAAGVLTPRTIAGTKTAILKAMPKHTQNLFPAILKRADADRGIDNFKLSNIDEVRETLETYDNSSLWILQEFIDNDGFYLVSFYDQRPSFCIFRELLKRPDGDIKKSHMYKPKGGHNASLIELNEVPVQIITECEKAVKAMNRQIASVDCIFDSIGQKAYILEVNYNPQLVTIETFKEVRIKAFLDEINNTWT